MSELDIQIQEYIDDAILYGASSLQDIRAYVTNYVSPALVTEEYIRQFLISNSYYKTDLKLIDSVLSNHG